MPLEPQYKEMIKVTSDLRIVQSQDMCWLPTQFDSMEISIFLCDPSFIVFIYQGSLADLKNIGGKGGGSITAALFLQEFVENAKWAHIDMAGTLFN